MRHVLIALALTALGCSALLGFPKKSPVDTSTEDVESDLDVIAEIDPDVPTDETGDPDAADMHDPVSEVSDPDVPVDETVEDVEEDAPVDAAEDDVAEDAVEDVTLEPDADAAEDPTEDTPTDVSDAFDASDVVDVDAPADVGGEETSCGAPVVTMSDVRVTSCCERSEQPVIAWSGSEFGLSWTEFIGSDMEIFFTRIDHSGTRTGTDLNVTAHADQSNDSDIVWTGSEYGVVWQDTRDADTQLYFARISAAGAKVGTETRVVTTTSDCQDAALAWTGSRFGVVWKQGTTWPSIQFISLDASGAPIGSATNVAGSTYYCLYPDVAWTGSEFGVAWNDSRLGTNEIFLSRLDGDGTEIGTESNISADDGSYSQLVSLAWTGSEFGYSWVDQRHGNWQIYFGRATPTGTIIGSDVRVSTGSADAHEPDLVWADGEYGVVWKDSRITMNSEIYFARISATGTVLGSEFRVSNGSSWSSRPFAAWTGSVYGVIWKDYRIGNYEVYFNVIDPCP